MEIAEKKYNWLQRHGNLSLALEETKKQEK